MPRRMKPSTRLERLMQGIAVDTQNAIQRSSDEQRRQARTNGEDIYVACESRLDQNYRFFGFLDSKKGQWRKFNELGYFEMISDAEIERQVHNFLTELGKDPKSCFTRANQHIKTVRFENTREYDNPKFLLINNLKVINSIDYVVEDFNRENPNHKFTRIENRNIIEPSERHLELLDMLLKIVTRADNDENVTSVDFPFQDESMYQRNLLFQWLINAAWNFCDDHIALVLIGPASAAKSIIVDVLNNMFPTSSGAFRIQDLGKNGGLANVYNKRIGTQNELNGGWIIKESLEKFKDILSNISKLIVRNLYDNPFEVKMNINLIIASNQLPKIPDGFESNSTYKRFLLLFCPNIFTQNEDLVREFEDPDFLDALMSIFLSHPPVTIIDDLADLIKRNKKLYQWSCDPIQRIVDKLYVKDYSNLEGFYARDVYTEILSHLERENAIIPRSLATKINDAIGFLGGIFKRNLTRGTGFFYDNGKEKTERVDMFQGISYRGQTFTEFTAELEMEENLHG
jgi:hypothetical protein